MLSPPYLQVHTASQNWNTFSFVIVTGPGTYNITGLGSESMRKAYIESTRRGVFGTTSVRAIKLTDKEQTEQPGPAEYQVKEKPFQSRYQQKSSMFASTSSRIADVPNIIKVSVTGSPASNNTLTFICEYDVQMHIEVEQISCDLYLTDFYKHTFWWRFCRHPCPLETLCSPVFKCVQKQN